MKFSEIDPRDWEELSPYLDTCLIPVTGLTGHEKPYEAAESLIRLRDIMDWVEIPFRGRVVTYPAIQYLGLELMQHINQICSNVKSGGFKYAIVISADVELRNQDLFESDLIITRSRFTGSDERSPAAEVMQEIQRMWTGSKHV